VLTFHRLGLIILQKYYKEIGLRKGFTLIDHKDRLAILEQICPGLEESKHDSISWKISSLKQHPRPHEQIAQEDPDVSSAWVQYQHMLIRLNCVDLDDLVFQSFQILSNPERQLDINKNIDHLFIDEYQDTNLIQYEFFKLLAPNGNFTLVGDDDQSIYTWRGANPENLFLVQKDFPLLEVFKLEQNYRCNPDILEAANKLIEHNPHLFPKKLWSKTKKEPCTWLLTATSIEDEAEKIASDLKLRFQDDLSYGILFRTNYQAIEIEKAFKEKKLSYKILGGTSIFQKSVIVDFLSYLRLILNEDDDLAFKKIINTPKRNIGPKKLADLIEHCDQFQIPLLKGCNEFRFLHKWDHKTALDFSSFHKILRHFQNRFRTENTLDWIHDLIAEIDYFGWIEQINPHEKKAKQQIHWVKDFIRWIISSHKKNPDLEEIIRKILLIDRLDQKEQLESKITLATIHSVKGLEFDEVYIFGCNEGLLPHKESDETIEEERRLMYVAMTRAKKRLVLSHSTVSKNAIESMPSRFLKEIGDDFLRPIEGAGPQSWEELRKQIGL
jgi:ATP-dependent DNA helicase Rep